MRFPDRRSRDLDPDRYGGQGVEPWGGGRGLPPGWDAELQRQDEIAAAARTRRTPYRMAGVTAAVGAGAWGAAQIAEAVHPGAGTAVEVATVAGSTLAVPALRAVLRASIPDRWARTWWVSTACAAGWVDVVATSGPGVTTTTAVGAAAALVLGTALLGARWFDEHEPLPAEPVADDTTTQPIPVPAAFRPVIDASDADDIETLWAARVAAGKSPIAPGAALTDRTQLPHGWRWVIELDQDESVGATALEETGVAAQVALKLGKRSTHVMLERLEDDPGEHLAMLTVVTRDVLADGVDYGGPDYDDGRIRIGDYADGVGPAHWLACDHTGPKSGLVTGEQGSGKSALMAALGMAYRASGEWIVLFGDGAEDGGSSRLLGEVAHDFARGPAEVLEQLEALEAWGRIRGQLMGTLTAGSDGKPTPAQRGQRPVDKILPCRAFPGFVWFLDEFYRLANDPGLQAVHFVQRVEQVVRFLRKYGCAVVIGTQSAMGDDFDGHSALRALVAGGNRVALRTRNKSEQGIADDGLAPHLLPRGAGYALLGNGERRAMIRTAHPNGMSSWVSSVVARGTPDRRSWEAYLRYRPVRELDGGVDYDERMAALDAHDRAVATGAPLPGSPEALAVSGQADPEDDVMAGVPSLSNVVPLHRPAPAAEPDPPAEPAPPLPANARRVLDDLAEHPGPRRSADIAAATGLRGDAVSKALKALKDRGLVRRVAQGLHQTTQETTQEGVS